jgi:DNA-binding NarL/FixJ family response regulator
MKHSIRLPSLLPHSCQVLSMSLGVHIRGWPLEISQQWRKNHFSWNRCGFEARKLALRILVVDDQEPVRRAITSILAKRNDWYVCGEASDGMEAIARAKELRPDAVLMDVTMPKMDGLKATHAVRQQLPETKIIIVSQNDPFVVRQQAVQAQAHGYVGKDAIATDLIPSIEKLFTDVASNNHIDPPTSHLAKKSLLGSLAAGRWVSLFAVRIGQGLLSARQRLGRRLCA